MSQALYIIEQYRLKREIDNIMQQQAFAPHLGLTGAELDDLDEELMLRKQAILADLNASKPHRCTKRVKKRPHKAYPEGISYRTRGLIFHQERIIQQRKKLRADYKKTRSNFYSNERLIRQLTPKAAELKTKLTIKNDQLARQVIEMFDKKANLSIANYAVNSHLLASLRRDYYNKCMNEHLDKLSKVIPNTRQFIRQNILDTFNKKRKS